MRIPHIIFTPILIISVLLLYARYSFSGGVILGDQKSAGGPIEIEADRLEFDGRKNIYTTRGSVEVVQGNRILRADMIRVNPETKEAVATGEITLIDGEDILKSDRMEINLDTQKGTIYNGRLLFKKENFHVVSKEIEKLGKDSYRIIDGSFTTCDGASPPWKFTGREVNVTIEGYATVKHAVFYLKDIPVLYFPYIIYPAKIKRQTGFLIPSIAYSKEEGTGMTLPFFWAISRSMDATFSIDYRSKRGVGEELEYRHIFSRNSLGNLYFYHMNETDSYRDWKEKRKGEELISSPDRWIVRCRHEQYFTPSFTAKIDVAAVSDRDFHRDFDEIVDDRYKEKLESTLFLTKIWQRFNLNSEFRYTEDLEKKDKTTLQTLPKIEFTGLQQRISTFPLFYNFTSTFDNFWREEGQRGQRIDIYPKILYTLHTDYFDFKPEMGARETLYRLDEGEDKTKTREIYDLNVELSTTIQRIFDVSGEKLKKLKHSIEPEVEYTFIPEVDQEGLPEFDSVDRIDRTKSITYSLTNELIGKISGKTGKSYYHKFARLKLSQSYDFIEAKEASSGSRRPFSAVSGELDIYPTQNTSLELDGEYNTYDNEVAALNVLLGLKDKRGNFLNLEYRNKKDGLEEINTRLNVEVLPSLDLKVKNRYSISNNTSSETIFGLEYKSQCWAIEATCSNRTIEDEDRREQKYMLRFSLAGVGEFGG